MKRILAIALVWGLLAPSASAATFFSGDTLRINLPDAADAYFAGSLVNLESVLDGDLIGAAQTVTVDKEVVEDVSVAGETIQINAPVGDDVRVAGSTIAINEDIEGDVLAFASTVTVAEGVTIGGDLVASAATVKVDGDVEGMLRAGGEQVVLTGTVGGDADVRATKLVLEGAVAGNATVVVSDTLDLVGDAERIQGDLKYYAPEDLSLENRVGGEVSYDESLGEEMAQDFEWKAVGASLFTLWTITRLLWAAVVIGTIMLLFNKYFRKASMSLHTGSDVAASFGWGSVALFLPPVAILALLISTIGLPIGLFAGALYVFGLFFTGSVTALFLSHLLNSQMQMEANNVRLFFMALGVYVVTMVVGLVPGLSFIIWLGLGLLAWGALIRAAKV